MAAVLVLVEPADGNITDVSLQALTLARSFANGETIAALVLGPGSGAAEKLGDHGVASAHIADNEDLEAFGPDAWAATVIHLADSISAGAVFAAATDRGNDVMARIGARLGLPVAANCIAVSAGPPVTLTRQRWGGSLLEEARLHSARPLITVAPHTVAIEKVAGSKNVEILHLKAEIDERDLVVRPFEHVAPPGGGVSLADAKVVVSGGRGVGSKEGFAIIEELAGLLGGRVGCSRVVTSAGWRPHTDQVGQTGTKISPDIYIACGISGATQHMAGCKGAKRILAINGDAEAPIMSLADYAVVGDLKEIVPAISAEIRKVK
jgi:electron transfer flavoprotein alpha subunit